MILKPLGELFTIYCISQLLAADAQIPFLIYLQAVIIISTSFMGAFMFVNGVDYFVENCKALYYTLNILHGKSLDNILNINDVRVSSSCMTP